MLSTYIIYGLNLQIQSHGSVDFPVFHEIMFPVVFKLRMSNFDNIALSCHPDLQYLRPDFRRDPGQ